MASTWSASLKRTMLSPTPLCRCARATLVSVWYATSRTDSDRNAHSSPSTSSELPADQRGQRVARRRLVQGPAELDEALPRTPGAEDGGVLEHVALVDRQLVEPGRHQAPQRVGQPTHLARGLDQCGQLLEEQRVAPAAVEQLLLHVGVDVAAEQRAHQLGSGLLVERVEAQEDRVLAPADRCAPALQLGGARRGDQGERLAAELGDDAVEQVEHQRIGPVEVADGDDERSLADEALRGRPAPSGRPRYGRWPDRWRRGWCRHRAAAGCLR